MCYEGRTNEGKGLAAGAHSQPASLLFFSPLLFFLPLRLVVGCFPASSTSASRGRRDGPNGACRVTVSAVSPRLVGPELQSSAGSCCIFYCVLSRCIFYSMVSKLRQVGVQQHSRMRSPGSPPACLTGLAWRPRTPASPPRRNVHHVGLLAPGSWLIRHVLLSAGCVCQTEDGLMMNEFCVVSKA